MGYNGKLKGRDRDERKRRRVNNSGYRGIKFRAGYLDLDILFVTLDESDINIWPLFSTDVRWTIMKAIKNKLTSERRDNWDMNESERGFETGEIKIRDIVFTVRYDIERHRILSVRLDDSDGVDFWPLLSEDIQREIIGHFLD